MKAHLKSSNGRVLVEVEGTNVKDLFEQLANVQEVIDADAACGACGRPEIKFRVREVKNFKYFELHCESCSARLQFGQLRTGDGLFAKRKTEEGDFLPDRGWQKYLQGPGSNGGD